MRYIDLHTHSTASDGSDTPSEIIQLAVQKNLAAVALCDHDTVSGIPEFLDAARGGETEAVPGLEISTCLYNHEVHIVGLFIDHECTELRELCTRMRRIREERNEKILYLLHTGGYEITAEDVAEFAVGESAGRPHMARALVKKGYFETVQQAFAKCLKRNTPFYVPRSSYVTQEEAIHAIHAAGGLAFWAHPLNSGSGTGRSKLKKFLKNMIAYGLDGLEGYYSLYTEYQQGLANAVAEEMGILVSGGSDYHGQSQPAVSMGSGLGKLAVPEEVFFRMKEKLGR